MALKEGLPNYLLIIFLAAVSFSLYLNSLSGDFLIDDEPSILNDQSIHNLNTYFRRHFKIAPGILDDARRAVSWAIGKEKPFSYHLLGVSYHASCTVLFFILCYLLFKDKALSFFSALIFSVHPIHTEAISWISGNPYAFSAIFFFAAMIFFVLAQKNIVYLGLAFLFFCLCFLAGQAIAGLALMFVLYELFFRKHGQDKISRLRLVIILGAIFLIGIFFLTVLLRKNNFARMIFYYRGSSYLVVATKAFLYYLKILYLPLSRGLYHPFAFNSVTIQSISPAFFVSLLVISLCVYLFFRFLREEKPLSFGIALFFATYLPYSNIIPVCNIVAERYLYLPSSGFCLILAYLILKVWRIVNTAQSKRALRILTVVVIALFLGAYATLTIRRNYEYSDISTYWQTNITNFPDGYIVYNNLAGSFYSMGDLQTAMAYCFINLSLNPNQPYVWCNLGRIFRDLKNTEQSNYCYSQALKISKNYPVALKALTELEALGKKEQKN